MLYFNCLLVTFYRFVFVGESKYEWLNAKGLFDHDVHSNNDFQIVAIRDNPKWINKSVFYQIFPDRFARSGKININPEWAYPRDWNELPRGRSKYTGQELYGGDLYGIEDKLNYLTDLGINGIYLTPIFPSRSNHRYDATTFDEVDPILGGDQAFKSLISSAKKKTINGATKQAGTPETPPGFIERISRSEPPDRGNPGSKRT